jgi:hypothetical protein
MSTNKRAMAVINRDDSTFQHILAHHSNPDAFPLNDKQQDILNRWRKIFAMQLRNHNRMRIVNALVNDGLSMSQAYADIKNVESFFGSVLKADKEFQRVLWLERANDGYVRALQKGKDELAQKYEDMIAKYSGFNDKDDAEFNAEKLENVKIEFTMDAKTQEALKNLPRKNNTAHNVVDFNNLNAVDTEFINVEYEED